MIVEHDDDNATTAESSILLLDEETIVSLVEKDVALQRHIYDSERIDYSILWEKLVEQRQREAQRADDGGPTTTGKEASSPSPPHHSLRTGEKTG
jgi:hypothetical protein